MEENMSLSRYTRYFLDISSMLSPSGLSTRAPLLFPSLWEIPRSLESSSEVWCPARDELLVPLPLGQVSHLCLAEGFLETRSSTLVRLGGGVGLGAGLVRDPSLGCSWHSQGFPRGLRAGKGAPFPPTFPGRFDGLCNALSPIASENSHGVQAGCWVAMGMPLICLNPKTS